MPSTALRLPDVAVHRVVDPRPGGDPRLAVAVITRDRRDELLATLGRLRGLPERPHVVVVDNGSADGTVEAVLREAPDVELIALAGNAGAAGRNLAARVVEHPYLAFADDDTWWDPGALQLAADLLDAHDRVAVLTGRIVVEPRGEDDPIVADMRDSPLPDEPGLPGRPLISFLAGASVVRREAFLAAGGFEPRLLVGGEEELLAADLQAAGWAVRYVEEMVVHHLPSRARDPHLRRRQGIRNTLWTTWLRRPVRPALRRTAAVLRGAPADAVTGMAVLDALRGARWVLAERRHLPAEVEARFRLMDDVQLRSGARRYVS
jgi:GT2 family glycosyltransferase